MKSLLKGNILLEFRAEASDPQQKSLSEKLEIFQNKALGFIYNIKGRHTSVTVVRYRYGIESLELRCSKL